MAKLTMDQGDTRRIVGDFTGSAAPFDDLSGATVKLYARNGSTGTVTEVGGQVDDPGADGKAHTCRSAPLHALPVGWYRATLEVAKLGEVERTTTDLAVENTAAPVTA